MSRWINADTIEESILDKWGVDPKYLDDSLEASKDSYLLDWVNSAPSIDIVQCKDCEHWNEEDHWCNIRDSYGWDYKPDDFCSYGEREGER